MKKHAAILLLMSVLVNCSLLQADPFSNIADIDNSGAVDPTDLNIFVAAWLSDDTPTPDWDPACDISDPNDGFIDVLDYAVLYANWLWAAPDPPDPLQFVSIPAGTFLMGDHHDSMGHSLPIHTVGLGSFYMSKYEITTEQYCDYLNSAYPAQIKIVGGIIYAADDSSNSFRYCATYLALFDSTINFSAGVFSVKIKDGTTDMSKHPMTFVSWYGSVAYCNWKSQQDGLDRCYNLSTWQCDFTKNGYRLPTEAQWEYAARGGNKSPYYRYPWGDSIDGSMANYSGSGDIYETGSYPQTTPVDYYDGGQTPAGINMANGYGLYDMAGNVYDWCNDLKDTSYYTISPVNNPTGPASNADGQRVVRGGHWYYTNNYCVTALRNFGVPGNHGSHNGFRVIVYASH